MDQQQPHQPGEQHYKEKAREQAREAEKKEQKVQPQEAGISNRSVPEELNRQEKVPPLGQAKK